jgi:hypothetical protein
MSLTIKLQPLCFDDPAFFEVLPKINMHTTMASSKTGSRLNYRLVLPISWGHHQNELLNIFRCNGVFGLVLE